MPADEDELKDLLKRCGSSKSPQLHDADIRLLLKSLVPLSNDSIRSLVFLCLSQFCEAVVRNDLLDSKTTESVYATFRPVLDWIFSAESDSEPETLIPIASLLGSLFSLAPLAAAQLLSTNLDLQVNTSTDVLTILLEAAELQSPLQPVLAELFSQAAGTKPGREILGNRAVEWLRGAFDFGAGTELGVLCAVALCKLGREAGRPAYAEENRYEEAEGFMFCDKMMSSIISCKPSTPAIRPALEGLSILSLRPSMKERLTTSFDFLTCLLALAPRIPNRGGSLPVTPRGSKDIDPKLSEPVETSICYGVTTILVHLTSKKPTMSAEDQQIAKLRDMAISGKKKMVDEEEDPRDSHGAVKIRTERVLKAGCVAALSGLARAESSLVKEGLGTLCLNLVDNRADRPNFVKHGGFKVLSGVVRDLMTPNTRSTASDSKTTPLELSGVLPAIQALAKLVITTPPQLLFPPPHLTTSLNALVPLYTLLVHPSSSLLQQFESLMALTNLASIDPSIASRIVNASVTSTRANTMWRGSDPDEPIKVVAKVEELMLDDNTMVRRAATELVCNFVSSPAGFAYITEGSRAKVNSRLRILLILADVDDQQTRIAAGGALAIITGSDIACDALLSEEQDGLVSTRSVWTLVSSMFEPDDDPAPEGEDEKLHHTVTTMTTALADPGLVHRAVIILLNLVTFISNTDKTRRNAEFAVARKAGIEEWLLEVLEMKVGEEVLQPTLECMMMLKKFPSIS